MPWSAGRVMTFRLFFPPPLVGAGKPSRIKDFSLAPSTVQTDRQNPMGGRSSQHEARLASLTLCSARGMARGAPVPLEEISRSASSVQQPLHLAEQWFAAASCGRCILSTVAPLTGLCCLTHTRER